MTKLLFAGMLTSLLIFTGCASVKSTASGSAAASAMGFGGTVTVTVTMESGKITSVEAEGPSETWGVGSIALTVLPTRMVDKNSVVVDTVAGATITSNAVLEAAKAAVAQINN